MPITSRILVKGKKVYLDPNLIIQIESSGNPKAYNKASGAVGLMQITKPVLEDWNKYHPDEQYTMEDLYDPKINIKVGTWYANKRIPQIFRAFKIEDTVENRIIAYNWGPGKAISYARGKVKTLPRETQQYIQKYKTIKPAKDWLKVFGVSN